MKCSSVKKHLEEYLLNELEPEVEIRVNEHLNRCKTCREVLDQRGDIHEVLKGVDSVHPPADLYDRLRKRIGVPGGQWRFLGIFPRDFVYSLTAFCLGVVVMFMIENYMLRRGQPASAEIEHEPTLQGLNGDTVAFYSVPAEHLVRR